MGQFGHQLSYLAQASYQATSHARGALADALRKSLWRRERTSTSLTSQVEKQGGVVLEKTRAETVPKPVKATNRSVHIAQHRYVREGLTDPPERRGTQFEGNVKTNGEMA